MRARVELRLVCLVLDSSANLCVPPLADDEAAEAVFDDCAPAVELERRKAVNAVLRRDDVTAGVLTC